MFKLSELFVSWQGEGRNVGRRCVFVRFAGCNLWSGRESDRNSAVCNFCDTDFSHKLSLSESDLVSTIVKLWSNVGSGHVVRPLVVFTGGEPALQLTSSLLRTLRILSFDVSVETNGTKELPEGVYFKTVSPKTGSTLIVTSGNDLKVVWPQKLNLDDLEKLDFRDFWLQPMDGIRNAIDEVMLELQRRPQWRLSLQTHKIVGFR